MIADARPKPIRKQKHPVFDRAELEAQYPKLSELLGPPKAALSKSWMASFSEEPQAMYSILADIIKLAHAKPGRVGQRPMPREEEVNLDALIYGQVSNDPLTRSLPKLMHMSERRLAEMVNMSKTQIQRVMAGSYEPDMSQLRRIAEAVNVPPTYFLEYRVAMVMAAMHNIMFANPNVATALYRRYLQVRNEEEAK
jgi:hypothetical protein